MAAVTLSHNITRQEDFEGTPGGTIGGVGGGPAAAVEAGLHYEASQCLARRIGGVNAERGFTYDHNDIGTVDMTSDGFHCILAKVFTALSAVINPGGTNFGIRPSTGATIQLQLGDDGTMGDDEDFALPAKGGYVLAPFEARVNAWHSLGRAGTNGAIATQQGIRLTHNVSATTGAGTSQAADSIDYTTDGLFLVGGDSTDPDGTFQDFVDADEGAGLTGAGRAGIWQSSQAGIIAYLTNYIGRTDAGTTTATVFTDRGFAVRFPGGYVSEGRNGLFFDLGNASTVITLTDGAISGSDRRYGGRSRIVRYFDTEFDVNGTTNRITITGHGFRTGDAIVYDREGSTENIGTGGIDRSVTETTGENEFYGSGTGPGASGAYWYLVRIDDDTIQLARFNSSDISNEDGVSNAFASPAVTHDIAPSSAGNGDRHKLTRTPDTRPNIEFSGTSGSATLTRVSLTLTRIITLRSVVTMTSCVISEGRQLILNDATLAACIISGPTTSIGEAYLQAIHAQDLDRIDDCSFTSGGLGHAIEITTDGGNATINTASLDNVSFSGYWTGDADNTGGVSFNASTGVSANQITFAANHNYTTGDPIYYSDEGGTAIGGLTDQALYFVEVVDADTVYVHQTPSSAANGATGNRITLTAGTSQTHKFYSANATIFNNTGAALTINVINGGSTPTIRNSAGSTTTVQNAVSVVITGITQGSAVVLQARETVGAVTAGDTLASGFANSSGQFVYSHNYQGNLDINVRVNNPGHAVAAIADDGGVFTDETEESTDDTLNDMNLLPVSPAAGDAYYLGHTEKFEGAKFWITDGNGTGSTITWEYWNGLSWSALTVTDGTSNFENTGHGLKVTWTPPGDWATTTVTNQANSGQLYYVRARLSTVGSANQTRARSVRLDATRYLPFPEEGNAVRTITNTGLTVTAVWVEDTIGQF